MSQPQEELFDPFASLSAPASNPVQTTASPLDDLLMTPQQEQVLLSPGKTPEKKVSDQKKVEDFLGDTMSLVNLDSLVTRFVWLILYN